ncbi:MAG: RNA polymerase sigma factor [Nakamurella sp.]
MRFYLDLPDAEIAAALDCPASTVRTLISRALAAMRITQARGSNATTVEVPPASGESGGERS